MIAGAVLFASVGDFNDLRGKGYQSCCRVVFCFEFGSKQKARALAPALSLGTARVGECAREGINPPNRHTSRSRGRGNHRIYKGIRHD